MRITDGYTFSKEIKTFEILLSELTFKMVRERRFDPRTGRFFPKDYPYMRKQLHKMADRHLQYLRDCFHRHLKKYDISAEEYGYRRDAFTAEAARIKATEYTAKIESRVTP